MHEAGLMQTALDLAADEARRAGAVVRRVVLRVGTSSGVEPDALRFAFEALAPAMLGESASLELDIVPGNTLDLARLIVEAP